MSNNAILAKDGAFYQKLDVVAIFIFIGLYVVTGRSEMAAWFCGYMLLRINRTLFSVYFKMLEKE